MSKLVWDSLTERSYYYGIDRGLLNVHGTTDVVLAWNGLVSIDETESDATELESFFDGMKYANFQFGGFYKAKIEAYGFPDDAALILGLKEVFPGLSLTAQPRVTFDLSYRTLVGEFDYRIHLVYNAIAAQPRQGSSTISDKVDAETLEWEISAMPPNSSSFRPSSHMVVNTKKTDPDVLETLEETLYGTVSTSPHFPTQQEVITMFTP